METVPIRRRPEAGRGDAHRCRRTAPICDETRGRGPGHARRRGPLDRPWSADRRAPPQCLHGPDGRSRIGWHDRLGSNDHRDRRAGSRRYPQADGKARDFASDLGKRRPDVSVRLYDDPADEGKLWKVRESGLGVTAMMPGKPTSGPGWEDSAVPPEHLGDYLRAVRKAAVRDADPATFIVAGGFSCREQIEQGTAGGPPSGGASGPRDRARGAARGTRRRVATGRAVIDRTKPAAPQGRRTPEGAR
jgi:hypothetical protein